MVREISTQAQRPMVENLRNVFELGWQDYISLTVKKNNYQIIFPHYVENISL